jgi:hypothetical protein
VAVKKKQLLVSIAIGLLCAGVGTFVVSQYMSNTRAQWHNYAEDLKKEKVKKESALAKLEDEYKSLKTSYQNLLTNPDANAKQNAGVPDDTTQRLVALSVDDAMGWNTKISKNSRVDVACTENTRGESITKVLLKNVKIHDIEIPEKAGAKAKLFLMLNPTEAPILVNSINSCRLYLIQSNNMRVNYQTIVNGKPQKFAFESPTPSHSPFQHLPPPAPEPLPVAVIAPPPAPTETLSIIKGNSQEVMEFGQ